MKIAVAMSGGVDSSVVAVLLKESGYEIFGATMRIFNNSEFGFLDNEGPNQDIADAKKICKKLGIEHHTIDVSKEFQKFIIPNFIQEYQKARTPNPCTLCNPTIKFGLFMDKCFELGADKFATGHYVNILEKDGKFLIKRGDDLSKDQSYMLWKLTQKQLSKVIFPLSSFSKNEIRMIAEKNNLHIAHKADSQEICFIKGNYGDFLQNKIENISGNIIFHDGRIIGRHLGLQNYTIGQRKGLNTPWTSALYVTKLDIETNSLFVTDQPDNLLENELKISDVLWTTGEIPSTKNLLVQIRYNSSPVEVEKITTENQIVTIKLKKKTRSITPGQSAVFYKNNILLGGGIIEG